MSALNPPIVKCWIVIHIILLLSFIMKKIISTDCIVVSINPIYVNSLNAPLA